MKKTILAILICGFMILGITGCGKTKNEFDVGDESDIQISQSDITLSIKDGTLTNIGATLILKNNGDKLLRYGEDYEIEIKQNGKWYKINAELEFNVPLWELEQNKSKELELKWEYGYGKLANGEYRILKNVFYENEAEQNFYISVEFTIE